MPSRYLYDRTTGHFIVRETGRTVSPGQVTDWIEATIKQSDARLGAIARTRQSGEISTPEWVIRTGEEITNLHRSVAMVGAGGRAQMTLTDWGAVGNKLRSELEYLNRFATELDNIPPGAHLTDQFVARARSYSFSAYETFESGVRRRVIREGQADEEENKLEARRDHCEGCREQTLRGRVPVGTLVKIGDRECRYRCRCRILYYKTERAGTNLVEFYRPFSLER